MLKESKLNDHLVEIGGEIYVSGLKYGNLWRVGVESPDVTQTKTRIANALSLKNMAMATSGNYRNVYETLICDVMCTG